MAGAHKKAGHGAANIGVAGPSVTYLKALQFFSVRRWSHPRKRVVARHAAGFWGAAPSGGGRAEPAACKAARAADATSAHAGC